MKFLRNEQRESYENAKICYICKEKFEDKYAKDKNIIKLEILVIIQVNIEVLHIAYKIEHVVYQNKLLWFFTMDQTMPIILKDNLIV